MPDRRKTVTLSLPPAMEEQLRQVAEEDGRTVSELLREGFRLYMEDREWRRQDKAQMRRSRKTNKNEERGGQDE